MLTNRRLVSIVTGVLILVMLIPVGLSIWLARRQAQETFTKELDAYSSRVMMHTQKVIQQAKRALNEIEHLPVRPVVPRTCWHCAESPSLTIIYRRQFTLIVCSPAAHRWKIVAIMAPSPRQSGSPRMATGPGLPLRTISVSTGLWLR